MERLTLEQMAENLHHHQIADESFQDAQRIHNLEMKETQKKLAEAINRLEEKMDQWLTVANSLSFTGKLLFKILAGCVALAAGLAALKYLLSSIITNALK